MNSTLNPSVVAGLVLIVLYLPLLLIFYWFTHVRRQLSSNRQVIRTKELSFFFMRSLDEQWKLLPQLLMSLLPSFVLAVGGALAVISLTTLLSDDDSVQTFGISMDAIVKYVRPVFFGFLGAYVFMLQTTLRRYLDDDLGIDTHIVITVRVIMALIVSFVAGFLLPARYKDLNVGVVLIYGAAFIFGVMPERGFDTLYRIVAGWLGDLFKRQDTEHLDDLQKCLGFDRVRLARLNVENIKTIEDMAHVEIERLAQKTRFDLQAIFYWVDRAIFYSQLGDSPVLEVLEANGIRTFSSFEVVYRDSETRESVQAQIASARVGQKEAEGDGRKDASPTLADLNLDVAYAAMIRIPNTQLVRLFMNHKAMQVTGAFEATNRAAAYEKMGQYEEAVVEYDSALERNPLDPTLLTRRGRARAMLATQQMRRGDLAGGHQAFERALHDFQRALDILPSSWAARVQRAITLLDQEPYTFDHSVSLENLGRAVEDLREAMRHNAEELEIVNWLGLAYIARGEYKKAVSLLRRAVKSAKYQALSYVRATAELVIARALIEQARKGAGERNVHRTCGKRDKFLKDAQSHIAQAQGLAPYSSLLFFVQAIYHHLDSPGSMQVERFLELALQPIDVQIDLPDARSSFSTLRFHIGDGYACDVYEMWGQLSQERGNVQSALACLTQAIALDPARVTTFVRRGELYERLGDPDAAIADYDFMIETMGYETPDVYLARARARNLASAHRPELAAQSERDIERAIALAPDRPKPLIAWGEWLRLTENYEEAIDAYDQAGDLLEAFTAGDGVQRDRVEVDLSVGRGLAHCGLSDLERARRAFRRADRLVGGERNRPSKLWIGWGVLYGLHVDDPEAHMNAYDALAHLAEEKDWVTVSAADLKQMRDVLSALTPGVQAMDRESTIKLEIAKARAAALIGAPDAVDAVDALCADIAALSDEMQRIALNALLVDLDELERFI